MKKYIGFCFLVLMFSCAVKKQAFDSDTKKNYEVVSFQVPYQGDTFQVNELRFYKIRSAKDAARMLYENYGRWTKKLPGRYQENINRLVWEDVYINERNEPFTIVADGTETTTSYFTCITVFDATGEDCLAVGHPDKEILTHFFQNKIAAIKENSNIYRMF